MPKTTTISVRLPEALLSALNRETQPGGILADYPSRNAGLVGILLYAMAFRRPHALTAGIAALPAKDQDTIHEFILSVVERGQDLGQMLPKPATAKSLLTLARK